MFLPQEVIAKKRDREPLSGGELRAFCAGIADGSVGEAQMAAFAMAVVLNGMDAAEIAALTLAMRDSGRVLDWSGLPGPVVDKHSTGGVGDKVSLILAPILAACGACVPMLSGRGLGHTGGTLDKLESLPGYMVNPDEAVLRRVVEQAGCAIVGAGPGLAPADAKLYAVRDVTSTVEAVPLITASILSKKLAAGVGALVMDVKRGSGAFLPDTNTARELARSLVDTAAEAGLPCGALITDMDRCLGTAAGNALEVAEAIEVLATATGDSRLLEVTLALAAEALVLGGAETNREQARAKAERALTSGAAAERFARMIHGLGGPADVLEKHGDLLPKAPVLVEATAESSGFVVACDVKALGQAVVRLGGGRTKPGAPIDHAVGLSEVAGIGSIETGQPLALVHARDEDSSAEAVRGVQAAFTIGTDDALRPSVVSERIVTLHRGR